MRTLLVMVVILVGCRGDSRPAPAPAVVVARDAGVADAAIATAHDREAVFLGVPTAKAVKATIERLAAKPHLAGTPANAQVGREIMNTLTRLGWRVKVAEYSVYLPHPRTLSVVVRGAKPFELAVTEPATAPLGTRPELLTWNAYSANGKVAAPVVYVGHGREAELAAIKAAGVDLTGKVALLRYGPLYRGAQVASVERHGAVAAIFYVDPKDEPARSRDSVQRGTVDYYWQYPGDPLTPGVAAVKDAVRKTPAMAEVLPKIPVLTVTANEAEKLLAVIAGPAATGELVGGLRGPYHLGPGPVVEVTVELDGELRTIRNIMALLPGQTAQTVVLGNHYDAWVYGALDPHSGTATLIEIARGLTALTRAGWQPRRTIILGFWDAAEFGMIGSTEWVEEQHAMLRDRAVAYFNIDAIKAGPLVVQGSPALRELVRSCAGDVVEPATGKPFAVTFEDLGIGSDGTAFLHHAGIPSLQWQTGPGAGGSTTWHSALDDAAYVSTQADPGFAFIPVFAKVMGLCALRLADADTVPLRFSETADWLEAAIAALARTTKLTLDRTQLDAALATLRTAAMRAESAPVRAGGDPAKCNQALVLAERGFLADDGLVDRPWYRHLAIGPDPVTGEGALLLPELAAARTQPALTRATARLTAAIERVAANLAPCP